MEIKQMKCPNCGSKIKVKPDEDGMATCSYCRTSFSIETDYKKAYDSTKGMLDAEKDALNETLNSPLMKGFKTKKTIISIVAALIICGAVVGMIIGISTAMKDEFNWSIDNYIGTQTGTSVNHLIDEVVKSNQTNRRQIEVCFDEICATEVKDLVKLKEGVNEYQTDVFGFQTYEVVMYYDHGYINKIEITTK